MKKKKEIKGASDVEALFSRIDNAALIEQLSKDDVANWIISKGVHMLKEGKLPGQNMINLLVLMKILK